MSILRTLQRYILRRPIYQPNFVKTKDGNGIVFGTELGVRIAGAEVVTGKVYDVNTNATYEIDQSHKNDEDKDAETVNFDMKTKLHPKAAAPNYFLPKGEYYLLIWYFDYDTMRGGTFTDKFIIF